MNMSENGKPMFYNTREDCVKHFLHDNPNLFDDTIPNEKDIFRMLAEELVNVMDSNVSGWEYETNYDGFVWDFYEDAWRNIIKPIIKNNQNLMQMISDIKAKETTPTIIQIPSKEVDEKKLEEIVDKKYFDEEQVTQRDYDLANAFKAGYRKAKEGGI